ncbi:MAG TPA: hypothetical protein VF241_13835 [Propionibacteriaceae bacterium]
MIMVWALLSAKLPDTVHQGWHWRNSAGVGAVGANLVDNLPSYLALEPAADASPLRLAALLVGVNAGPLITPWASLATMLWAARCRSASVAVSWRRFAARGAVLVPLLLPMSVTSLWLAHG